MEYTAAEILLFIAAIGAIITSSISAWRAGTKLDNISQKAAVIEGHVNSRESKLTEQLLSKDKEIEVLKDVIVEKDKDKSLLAQAVATKATELVNINGAVKP